MGGPGSGNFSHGNRPAKKPLVEYSKRLDVSYLHRHHWLGPHAWERGTITFGGTSTIGVETLIADAEAAFIRLTYTTGGEPPISVDDVIGLTTTRPQFGGVRWWFRCPGAGCGRRVGILYLPHGGIHFRCRTCHGLTYSARQNAHSDRVLMQTELGQALRPLLALIRREEWWPAH